jgi:CRP-like cAMP-binding protein
MVAPRADEAHRAGRLLLELDPDLGQLLSDERRAQAERELRVHVTALDVGEWDTKRLTDADPTHLGLLVLDGVLAREVLLGETVSTELLGPGDIVRPWLIHGEPELLHVVVRWNALSPVRLALLDRRIAALLGHYPEIGAVIADRLAERSFRLAVTQAISQLNRVDRRLLVLFWHLAERWGKVAPDGIAIPLVLSHRLIGELVGARRPTVSTAAGELARDGQLIRREDGTWLLTGDPVGVPGGTDPAEVIRQRRRLIPTPAEPLRPSVAHEPGPRLVELRTSLEAAQAASRREREALDALRMQTRAIRERTNELRAQHREHLDALRAAARVRGS